jgi:hypothetical protein
LFKFSRKEEVMKSVSFRKPVAFFVALVFVFTSVLVSPVFADFNSVSFKDAGPAYAEGDDYGTALKPLNMQVTVASGITTPQALTLSLTGANAGKFYLSKDATPTVSAISALTVDVTTWSALTFDVTAYIGVTSGSALSASDTVTITAKDANSAEQAAVTVTVPTPPPAPKYDVTVKAGTGGTVSGVTGAGQYAAGAGVTIDATANVTDATEYEFLRWIVSDASGTVSISTPAPNPLALTFTMPANDVTITAEFHKLPVVSTPETPSGGSNTAPDVTVELEPDLIGDTAVLDETEVDNSIAQALTNIVNSTTVDSASITIEVDDVKGATELDIPMSASTLEAIAAAANNGAVTNLVIESEVATVDMDKNALSAISNALNTMGNPSSTVEIVLNSDANVAAESLGGAAKTLLDNQTVAESPVQNVQVFDISVLIDKSDAAITGTFKIALPYTPTDSKNEVTVNYINAGGDVNKSGMSGIYYDKVKGLVTFSTTHLSMYAVVESTPPTPPPGTGGGGGSTPVVPEEEEPEDEKSADSGSTGSWADNPFSDVRAADWFYADVEYAVKNGLFEGTSANAFSPNTSMTRGMIVTVLGRLYDADVSEYTDSGFSDVAAGQYYTAYVEWAKDNGIVNGVGDNMFAPNTAVSRQDFAVLLMRYADFAQKQFPTTRQFSVFEDDADIADYAKNAIQTLYNGGIINGVGGNAINPQGSATRAEVAAMLHRFIEAAK